MPPKQSKPGPASQKYGSKSKYTEATLQKALKELKENKISQRKATQLYNIPRSTLTYKLSGVHTKDVGRPSLFSKEEEDIFETHILALCHAGVPMNMVRVRCLMKQYLDSSGRNVKGFINNMPGWKWGKLFLKRHPALKQKVVKKVQKKERPVINKSDIHLFFDNLEEELRDVPPENIYNIDEIAFHDVPKNGQFLFHRNSCNPESVLLDAANSSFTVMFGGNAAGDLLPPYFIFKCRDEEMSDWLAGAPPGSRMNVTKSGWIDTATFEDFFGEHLLPFLRRTEGKKVIIGDRPSIHLSVKTLNNCVRNGVSFISLPPNSKHFLQPLVVGLYSVLKEQWQNVLENWRRTENGEKMSLPHELFAQLLTDVLNVVNISDENISGSIISGFKATGIFPPSRLLKLPKYAETDAQDEFDESLKSYAEEILEANLSILQQAKKHQLAVAASVDEGKSVRKKRASTSVAAPVRLNKNLSKTVTRSQTQKEKKTTVTKRLPPKGKKKQAEEVAECPTEEPPVLHLPETNNHDQAENEAVEVSDFVILVV